MEIAFCPKAARRMREQMAQLEEHKKMVSKYVHPEKSKRCRCMKNYRIKPATETSPEMHFYLGCWVDADEFERLVDRHKIEDHGRDIPIGEMIYNMPTVLANRKSAALTIEDRIAFYMDHGENEAASYTIPDELWSTAQDALDRISFGEEEENDVGTVQVFLEICTLLHLLPRKFPPYGIDTESVSSMEEEED